MITYLSQVKAAAAAAGLRLEDVAKAEGIHRWTLWSWKYGKHKCSYRTAKRLLERIEEMSS